MRPFNVKLLGCIGIIMVLAMIINGCGSGNDLLDEVGGRTVANLEISDGGDDDTQAIDTAVITDCDANGVADDPEDPLTPVSAIVSVSVATNAPGVHLLSYVVNFIPVPTVGRDNLEHTPPTLPSKSGQFNSVDVDSGSSGSDSILIMSVDQKLYVDTQFTAAITEFFYTIEVVLTLQDYEGNIFTQTVYRDVDFYDVDRC